MKYCPKTSFGDEDTDYNITEKDGGIYAIGFRETTKDVNQKQTIKIGQTTSLCKRMYEYHTCFPDGVSIYAILKVPRKKGRPAQGETYSKKLIEMENYIHHKLRRVKHKQTTRVQGQGEWFDISYTMCVEWFQYLQEDFGGVGDLDIFDLH